MNIKMTYLHRDGGNYKTWYDVVFPNHTGKTAAQLTAELQNRLIDGMYFDQSMSPIPFEYPDSYDPELDHTWLEFNSFEEASDQPQVAQDIMEFIEAIAGQS